MLCAEAQPFYADLADHSLPENHAAREHLMACRHCSTEFQQYQLLIARLGALPRPLPVRDLRQGIHARLGRLDRSHRREAKQTRLPFWRFFVPATGAAAIALASWLAMSNDQDESRQPTETASVHPVNVTGSQEEPWAPVNVTLETFTEELLQPFPAFAH